jgi:DNA-binding response OmpR family regulator
MSLRIAKEAPDLVVLGLMAGRVAAGWDAFTQLGAQAESAATPVLLASSSHRSLYKYSDEIRARGVDILLKPFRAAELLAIIKALLAQQAGT